MYVDHFLQAEILSRLAAADGPLRFSELKEDGIENSLFMYHARKLLTRHIMTKAENGFALTVAGANFVNSVGIQMNATLLTPKPLIQFIICDNEGNILLSRRKGQMARLLNEIMLPGGLHKAGFTADENAVSIFNKWFKGVQSELSFVSLIETIRQPEDSLVYHSLAHVFSVTLTEKKTPADDERFSFEWVPLVDIHKENPRFSQATPLLKCIKKWQSGELYLRESFVMR